MKKFMSFFGIVLILFGAVFIIYYKFVRPSEYIVFVESFKHGVITADNAKTTGTDEKFRIVCKRGEEITININPERTDTTYYNLSKLLVNGVNVTDDVNMLQYKTNVNEKLSILAYFKKGERPSASDSQETSLTISAPKVEKLGKNSYLGSLNAYDIEDPSIIYDSESKYYYCFGSNNVVVKSTDLVNWIGRTNYFDVPGGAISDDIMDFEQFDSVLSWSETHGYGDEMDYSVANERRNPITPDIVKIGSEYFLYFSITKSDNANESAIFCVKTDDLAKAVATSTWTDVGIVMNTCGRNSGSSTTVDEDGNDKKISVDEAYDASNATDPCVFLDENKKIYMSYGSYFGTDKINGGIYLTELDSSTGLLKKGSNLNNDGETVSTLHGETRYSTGTLIAKPGRIPALSRKEGSLVSATDIVYNTDTGYYYLFVTYGTSQTNFNIRVARSENINGPYTDMNSASMADFSASIGKNQYSKGVFLIGGYNFIGSSGGNVSYTDVGRASIGAPSIIKLSNGKWLMASQSQVFYKDEDKITTGGDNAKEKKLDVNALPALEIRQLVWTDSGWPSAMPEVYAGEKPSAKIKASYLYGNWDVIIHDSGADKDDYTAVARSTSQTVSIFSNCVISEKDINKKKKLHTDTLVKASSTSYNITIDSVTFTVYPVVAWDWELNESAIVFTGYGEDGTTIWGKNNFSDALGINSDTFYYLLKMIDKETQDKFTKKMQSISSNPSQIQIDAMSASMVKLILKAQAE